MPQQQYVAHVQSFCHAFQRHDQPRLDVAMKWITWLFEEDQRVSGFPRFCDFVNTQASLSYYEHIACDDAGRQSLMASASIFCAMMIRTLNLKVHEPTDPACSICSEPSPLGHLDQHIYWIWLKPCRHFVCAPCYRGMIKSAAADRRFSGLGGSSSSEAVTVTDPVDVAIDRLDDAGIVGAGARSHAEAGSDIDTMTIASEHVRVDGRVEAQVASRYDEGVDRAAYYARWRDGETAAFTRWQDGDRDAMAIQSQRVDEFGVTMTVYASPAEAAAAIAEDHMWPVGIHCPECRRRVVFANATREGAPWLS